MCEGGDECCTTTNKCGVGEGDCDSDTECYGSLKCGTDNCVGMWGSIVGFAASSDCCFDPGIFHKKQCLE